MHGTDGSPTTNNEQVAEARSRDLMTVDDPFQISMQTAIAASSLLGHFLEDRDPIRKAQDPELSDILRDRTAVRLRQPAHRHLFACAPLDLLVSRRPGGGHHYHLIELNGTGIGGLTNLPGSVVGPICEALTETAAAAVQDEHPVFVLGVSGKESDERPRLNKLMHEKLLFADALKRGLQQRSGGEGKVFALPQLAASPKRFAPPMPAVVVGYMKELLAAMSLRDDGRLLLGGRPVSGILNDRFVLNVLDAFAGGVDLQRLATINRSFVPGADKGVVYELLNEHLQRHATCPHLPPGTLFETVTSREALVATVLRWVRRGRKVVIKPHATGVGHGIEFFLDPHEDEADIIARIDGSIRLTVSHYRAEGGAFPYTVCEFIDTCMVERPAHPLAGHKFELRVVVYRDGDHLRAFPSIVKVACVRFDAAKIDKRSLINNVTAATEEGNEGVDFMLPLTHRDTLDLLDIPFEELCEVSRAMCEFVARVVEITADDPTRVGLPVGDFQARLG